MTIRITFKAFHRKKRNTPVRMDILKMEQANTQ